MADSPGSPEKLSALNISISNGVYLGDLVDNPCAGNGLKAVRHGQGTMKYFNGNVYIGNWRDDCFDGSGEYFWADGRKYVGTFKKDKLDGRGVGIWPDGRKYEGEYTMDQAHGHGVVTLPNDRTFEGTFAAGFPVSGEMIDSDGSLFLATFDGKTQVSEWKPKTRVPIGKFEEGWMKPDQKHSLREFAWQDGRRFAGSFDGFKPVVGVLTEVDGSQYLVSYDGCTTFSRSPPPLVKIKLKTEVNP
jgi:hypothetical protein